MTERARGSPPLVVRARELEAERDFPGVVALLEPLERADLLREPELGYRLAYAWRRVGRSAEALPLTVSLDVPVRRRAEPRLARRRLSLEALLRYDAGELLEAERLWEELAAQAAGSGDHELLAAAHNNLGIVETLRDRPGTALTHYGRALVASQRLGDRRGLAQAHQNLGILFRELGAAPDAERHFDEAVSHAEASRSEDVLGRAEEERALLLLDAGDTPLAVVTAERALRRLAAIGDAPGVGEALRVLGIAALRERDLGTAGERLRRALDHARRAHHALLEAETAEALAALADARGRGAEAREHRAAADALFTRIGAAAWGARIRRRTLALAGIAASSAPPGAPAGG